MLKFYVQDKDDTENYCEVTEKRLVNFCLNHFGQGGYTSSGTAMAMQKMQEIRQTASKGGVVDLKNENLVAFAVQVNQRSSDNLEDS